jgi:hypothetical protein
VDPEVRRAVEGTAEANGGLEAAGAWLVELDRRPILCGFDEWVVIDGATTPEEHGILHDLGVLTASSVDEVLGAKTPPHKVTQPTRAQSRSARKHARG